jgi:hypothetical protein
VNQLSSTERIVELDWLKALALFLIVFVHSNLYLAVPQIINPVKWFLLSALFFVSGYLAYNSFKKRKKDIRSFLKSKFWFVYVPFFVAVLFYFAFFYINLGKNLTATYNLAILTKQITLIDLFHYQKAGLYDWGFLWFIPILLVFLITFCILEKYVKNPKTQAITVLAIWLLSILSWVFDAPFKLDIRFSQYILVFMFGFWLNKFNIFQKIAGHKIAVATVPFFVLFLFDAPSFFNTSNLLSSLGYYIYFNVRSIALSLSIIIILFSYRDRFTSNKLIDSIAKISILIYLSEAFVSYVIRNQFFNGQLDILVSNTPQFISYEAARVCILFLFFPLIYVLVRKFWNPKQKPSAALKR